MILEELLKFADKGYDSLIPFVDEETGELLDYDCGDSLALFVVRELESTFVPSASQEDQINTAIEYMEKGKDDLERVIAALQVAQQDLGT